MHFIGLVAALDCLDDLLAQLAIDENESESESSCGGLGPAKYIRVYNIAAYGIGVCRAVTSFIKT